MDKETGFRTRSILCMAIKNHRGEIAGVLQVMNKKNGTFHEEDERLLSAFCAQAAVAIENSRLFQPDGARAEPRAGRSAQPQVHAVGD